MLLKSIFISLFLLVSINVNAAEDNKFWEKYNPKSEIRVNFSKFDNLLQKYVSTNHKDKTNRFDYESVTDDDKKTLKTFIEEVAKIKVTSLNKNTQLAYWINIYNALTINIVLDNYPVESIKDIGIFRLGPWDKALINIENENISLNDIKNRIIRPTWKDNRIHYALNTASIGSPNIQNKAFSGLNIERDLDILATEFINSNKAIIVIRDKLETSSIYKEFKYDFGNSDRLVIRHLRIYANKETRSKLQDKKEINDNYYNWKLNKK